MAGNNLVQKTCGFERIRKSISIDNILVSSFYLFQEVKDRVKYYLCR